jgi:hypothetical protein
VLLPGNEALRFILTYHPKQRLKKRSKKARKYKTVRRRWRVRRELVQLVKLHNEIKRLSTYDDILSLCMEAAWTTLKSYIDGDIDFHLYFIRGFRWKIARSVRRHLRIMAPIYIPIPTQELTPPPIEDIIDYGRLNDWTAYLSWGYNVNGLTTRQIEKLTGLSKSYIAKEVKKFHANTW